MSGVLVEAVFASNLSPDVKIVAAALATFARDDGALVFPGRKTVARMVGKSERRVQAAIAELRARGVLELVSPPRPKHVTRYRWRSEGLQDQRSLFSRKSRRKTRNPHES